MIIEEFVTGISPSQPPLSLDACNETTNGENVICSLDPSFDELVFKATQGHEVVCE